MRKISEEQKRYRSINAYVVLFVFSIMVVAGMISMLIFNILNALGLFRHMEVVPMLLPLVMLCSCIIIGSILTAMLSGIFLRPLNDLKKGLIKVSKGDFSVRLEQEGNGEIAHLQENFNIMVQELQNTELFRNDFINDFSHEFKTPMVSVYGFAKQLKKGGLTKEQEKEYIDIIINESQRLINMSSNILVLNKLEKQEIITDKKEFSLDEELRRCILQLQEQWSAKNQELIPELDDVKYYGNSEMLKQVWLNVIGNAIKYTQDGGTIEIRLDINPKNSNEIRVRVTDNGIGMDKATTERIFEKFYQGDSSHATGGNGLGLPMVKRIVELCGGRIKVKSELNKGTQFTVYLPIEDKENEDNDEPIGEPKVEKNINIVKEILQTTINSFEQLSAISSKAIAPTKESKARLS